MQRAGMMTAGTAALAAMVAGVITLAPAAAQTKKEAPLVTTGDAAARPWKRYSGWPTRDESKWSTLAKVASPPPPKPEDVKKITGPITGDAKKGEELVADRNPVRHILTFEPLGSLPVLAFRFKLEQASPLRALVRTRDGRWHVGQTWVQASGGGCTVPGQTRSDGSWSRTLGQVQARFFLNVIDGSRRLRLQPVILFRQPRPLDFGDQQLLDLARLTRPEEQQQLEKSPVTPEKGVVGA